MLPLRSEGRCGDGGGGASTQRGSIGYHQDTQLGLIWAHTFGGARCGDGGKEQSGVDWTLIVGNMSGSNYVRASESSCNATAANTPAQ